MDLLDFNGQDLYFDEGMADEVEALLNVASAAYAEGEAELPLLRAYFIAPRNLTVLVALYRFYFYQHRLDDALVVAHYAMEVAADKLGLPGTWQDLHVNDMSVVMNRSIGLLRFYLLALKGAGYLCMRLGEMESSHRMLTKVIELDPHDRLGAGALLELLEQVTDSSRLSADCAA